MYSTQLSANAIYLSTYTLLYARLRASPGLLTLDSKVVLFQFFKRKSGVIAAQSTGLNFCTQCNRGCKVYGTSCFVCGLYYPSD